MLQIQWIEIFIRTMPEMLLVILGIYIVTKETFNVKNYILITLVMSIATYFIRLLPIYFGVHSLICIAILVSLMVIYGMPIIRAIYGVLTMYCFLSASEFLNLLILKSINNQISFTNIEGIEKCILGIPSLIILVFFILIIYYLPRMREGMEND